MKKAILFLMALAVMASTMWFNVGTASAGSSNVSFYANGVTQADVKNAQMLVNSDYVDVYCALKEDNLVVCNIPGKYAGEDVQIYIGGQVFSVSVPELKPVQETASPTEETSIEEPLTCEDYEATGADVQFTYKLGGTYTTILYGGTLADVAQIADNYLAITPKFLSYIILSDIYCVDRR